MASTAFDTTRKARWVAASLEARPIEGVEVVAPEPLAEADVAAVHDAAYVRAVRTGRPKYLAGSNGLGWDDALFPAVLASNGGAVRAALDVLPGGASAAGIAGSLSSGLHHAKRGHGDGFCTFNGLALAARAAQAGAGRILVVDLDAHCGGGTFDLLGDDPGIDQLDVAVSSYDRYAPGGGWTLDIVSTAGSYLPTIRRRMEAIDAAGTTYDLVIYNAGMDPFEGCRVGGLAGITREVLSERERLVFEWTRGHGWPVAFVLAGGYARDDVGRAEVVELHRETIRVAAEFASADLRPSVDGGHPAAHGRPDVE